MLQHNCMLRLIKQHVSERTQVLWPTFLTFVEIGMTNSFLINVTMDLLRQLFFLDAPASIEVTQVSESMCESVIVSN